MSATVIPIMSSDNRTLAAALEYAGHGFSVIPCTHVAGRTPADKPICSCGLGEHCASPGKHPAISWSSRQVVAANEAELREWFGGPKPRFHNLGIVTGAVSGNIFVIDVDVGPGKEGADSLRALQLKHEDLPSTAEVKTGGGGRHLYFRAPAGVRIQSDKDVLGPGIDIRGEGGFVVAPPSIHASRNRYLWDFADNLETTGVAPAPAFLLELVKDGAPRPAPAETAGTIGTGPRQVAATVHATTPVGTLGIQPPKRADGREAYMHATIAAVLNELIGTTGAAPTPDELYEAAWPQYDRKVDWHSRPGRGPEEFRRKVVTTLRRFHNHQIRGMRTLEEAVETYRAKKAGATRQQAAGPVHIAEPPITSPSPAHTDGRQDQPASRLPLVYANEITSAEPALDFVEGMLVEGGMSVWYGDSNVGKTFCVLDLAMHVALGRPYRGREVDQGGVIYCALEGVGGIRNRVAAWLKHHGVAALKPEDVPIAIIPAAINMLDVEADVPALVEAIKIAAARLGVPVKLIVIDTLSRALAGGNENSPEDMGALVRSSDYVRQSVLAHLAYIHHSGKDAARGARGHSLLRAATDTEVEISRPEGAEISVIKITKQRELEIGDEIGFRLETIPLGHNRRGKPLTSCVAVEADGAAVRTRQVTARLTGTYQPAFMRALTNVLAKKGERVVPEPDMPPQVCVTLAEWREELQRDGTLARDAGKASGALREAWRSTPVALRTKGLIGFNETFVWRVGGRQEASGNVRI